MDEDGAEEEEDGAEGEEDADEGTDKAANERGRLRLSWSWPAMDGCDVLIAGSCRFLMCCLMLVCWYRIEQCDPVACIESK